MVAVDVDVDKTVVRADLLQLRIGGEQRAPVPEPDVVDGPAVLCERLKGEILRCGERFHLDRAEIVSLPGEIDVLLNVWPFRLQLARFDIETLDERGCRVAEDEGAAEHHERRREDEWRRAQPHVGERGGGRDEGQRDEQPERRQLDMDVGVAGADHDAVVVIEQEVAVQRISPRLHQEEEADERRAVGDRRGGEAPARRIEADVAVHEIDRAGRESARSQ